PDSGALIHIKAGVARDSVRGHHHYPLREPRRTEASDHRFEVAQEKSPVLTQLPRSEVWQVAQLWMLETEWSTVVFYQRFVRFDSSSGSLATNVPQGQKSCLSC